jgi:hypothetical protein
MVLIASISSKEHFKEIGWEQRPGRDAVIPGGLLYDHRVHGDAATIRPFTAPNQPQ